MSWSARWRRSVSQYPVPMSFDALVATVLRGVPQYQGVPKYQRVPDVSESFAAAHAAAYAAIDPDLLELSRRLVVSMLGGPVEADATAVDVWSGADVRERACLAFCEQFVTDVASMGDELASAVAEHLGPEGLSDYANALLVIEQRERLRLAWERLFGDRIGAA